MSAKKGKKKGQGGCECCVLVLQKLGFFSLNVLSLSFLVDACSFLLERAGTVGLFRKPGSLPRIKSLRVSCPCS